MIKIPVYLRDMCDAKHLVQAASGCEKNVLVYLKDVQYDGRGSYE